MQTRLSFLFLLVTFCCLQVQAQNVVFQQELKGEVFPIGHLLRWQTSFEAPGVQFILEKSTDGLTFQELAQVNGKGGSSIQNEYQYLAPDVIDATNFYRLRIERANQAPVLSSIIPLQNRTANQFVILRYSDILPTTSFDLEVQGRSQGSLKWHLRHLDQTFKDSGEWILDFGVNPYSLDLSGYPVGPYQLTLQMGNEVETLTIRKVSEAAFGTTTASSDALPTSRH
ncbi:MAG: hypothetical protein K9I85_11725 [Saprospiraceae bacterium]|nr:hypothetical protein [Saprospiraceae bacterium]